MTTWETLGEDESYAETGYYVEDYTDDDTTIWTVID